MDKRAHRLGQRGAVRRASEDCGGGTAEYLASEPAAGVVLIVQYIDQFRQHARSLKTRKDVTFLFALVMVLDVLAHDTGRIDDVVLFDAQVAVDAVDEVLVN